MSLLKLFDKNSNKNLPHGKLGGEAGKLGGEKFGSWGEKQGSWTEKL